jgi:60 kDa SS-A/Ro ribonucleoprotein
MFTPKAEITNEAGGLAYELSPKATFAQCAATGCLNQTFYADANEQLKKVLELTKELDGEFIAKTAICAREKGFMKDISALLVAVLSTKDKALLEKVFPHVIDNGKMLRNFVPSPISIYGRELSE